MYKKTIATFIIMMIPGIISLLPNTSFAQDQICRLEELDNNLVQVCRSRQSWDRMIAREREEARRRQEEARRRQEEARRRQEEARRRENEYFQNWLTECQDYLLSVQVEVLDFCTVATYQDMGIRTDFAEFYRRYEVIQELLRQEQEEARRQQEARRRQAELQAEQRRLQAEVRRRQAEERRRQEEENWQRMLSIPACRNVERRTGQSYRAAFAQSGSRCQRAIQRNNDDLNRHRRIRSRD